MLWMEFLSRALVPVNFSSERQLWRANLWLAQICDSCMCHEFSGVSGPKSVIPRAFRISKIFGEWAGWGTVIMFCPGHCMIEIRSIAQPYLISFPQTDIFWRVYMAIWLSARNQQESQWASYQMRKIAGCECRERFPLHRLQTKLLVGNPNMHHGTRVTHVP